MPETFRCPKCEGEYVVTTSDCEMCEGMGTVWPAGWVPDADPWTCYSCEGTGKIKIIACKCKGAQ